MALLVYYGTKKCVIDDIDPTAHYKRHVLIRQVHVPKMSLHQGECMKVVAFNGSPNKNGNTYHAIKMVIDELEKQGIATEIIHVGNKAVRG